MRNRGGTRVRTAAVLVAAGVTLGACAGGDATVAGDLPTPIAQVSDGSGTPTPASEPAAPLPATPLPTATPTEPVIKIPPNAVLTALDWLSEQPDLMAAFGDNLGAAPCAQSIGSLSHCYFGPTAHDQGNVVVFASPGGRHEVALLVVTDPTEDFVVAQQFPVPSVPDPFARPRWYQEHVNETLLDAYIEDRGFGDPTGAPAACPAQGTPTVTGVVEVNTTLNVRNEPGLSGEIFIELGPGFSATVFDDGGRLVGGDLWLRIRVPVPPDVASTFGTSAWGCGWVRSDFVELPLGDDGFGLARCRVGAELVFGGQTASGEFDVAVCADSIGGLEYVGVRLSDGDDIRLAACRTGAGDYIADNGGARYRVVDGGLASQSSIELTDNGSVELSDAFALVSGRSRSNVDRC